MIGTEALRTPYSLEELAAEARLAALDNRLLVKVGMAAIILDEKERILVSRHEGRDGEFAQHALGPVMETFRYVIGMPRISATDTDKELKPFTSLAGDTISEIDFEPVERRTETPLEVFQRSLTEELEFGISDFERAALYFDRTIPVDLGEWTFGPSTGFRERYAKAATVIARTDNPAAFESARRLSEECLGTLFMSIDQALTSHQPARPGFREWLTRIAPLIPLSDGTVEPFVWTTPPVTGEDVRYPFEAAA